MISYLPVFKILALCNIWPWLVRLKLRKKHGYGWAWLRLANFSFSCMKVRCTTSPPPQAPQAYFPPSYIKSTPLPLNIGIGHKLWDADSSNVDVIPRVTGLWTYVCALWNVLRLMQKWYFCGNTCKCLCRSMQRREFYNNGLQKTGHACLPNLSKLFVVWAHTSKQPIGWPNFLPGEEL